MALPILLLSENEPLFILDHVVHSIVGWGGGGSMNLMRAQIINSAAKSHKNI